MKAILKGSGGKVLYEKDGIVSFNSVDGAIVLEYKLEDGSPYYITVWPGANALIIEWEV